MTASTAENYRDRLAEWSNSTWSVREVVKDLTHEVFLISSGPCRAYTSGCTGKQERAQEWDSAGSLLYFLHHYATWGVRIGHFME